MNDDDCDDPQDSADEALCELLGLPNLKIVVVEDDDQHETNKPPSSLQALLALETSFLVASFEQQGFLELYRTESISFFPESLFVAPSIMRRLSDELVWGAPLQEERGVDKTYETIAVCKQGQLSEKRVLTRLENFVSQHKEWRKLSDYIGRCLSVALGEDYVLFKEKLNLKPPGGSGFAPHLDTPSLRIALGESGPQNFVAVMVAIDNMTVENGCLRICKSNWTADNAVPTVAPDMDGNPDAGGRAGAILDDTGLEYTDLVCKSGAIAAFGGWAPHKSSANQSAFPRRAVFLTYNPASEGDCHDLYYQKMTEKRNQWKEKIGLLARQDELNDLNALASVPR